MPFKLLLDDAKIRLGRLRRRLGNALKGGYISGGLKDLIEQDLDFYLFLFIKPINKKAFNYEDKCILANFAFINTL